MIRHWWLICAGLIVAALMITAANVPLWTEIQWMDPLTGSMRRERVVLRAISLGKEEEESSLAKWLDRHESSRRPREWQFIGQTAHGAFWTSYACGRTPAVYPLHGIAGDEVVAALTDVELAELARLLRHGSELEQELAVKTAVATALDRLLD